MQQLRNLVQQGCTAQEYSLRKCGILKLFYHLSKSVDSETLSKSARENRAHFMNIINVGYLETSNFKTRKPVLYALTSPGPPI
jgi:hypothetical protein